MLSETDAELIQHIVRAMATTGAEATVEPASDESTPPIVALTLAAQRKSEMALHLLLALLHCSDEATSQAALKALCATGDANALIALALMASRRNSTDWAVQRLMDTKGVLRAARPLIEQLNERLAHRGRVPKSPSFDAPPGAPAAVREEEDPRTELLRASAAALEHARTGLLERLHKYDAAIERTWGSVESIGIILKISQRLEVIARESVHLLAAQLGMEGDQLVKAVTGSSLPLDRGTLGVLLLVLSRLSANGVLPAEALRMDARASVSVLGQFVADRNRITHELEATRTSLGAVLAFARAHPPEASQALEKQLAFRRVVRHLGDILRWVPADWTMAHLEMLGERTPIVFPSTKLRRFEIRDELRVGRAPDATLWVSSPEVSRRHLVIERAREGGRAVLHDRSSGRTLLNGKPVEGSATLTEGDTLEVGPVTFIFREGSQPSLGD